MRPPGQPSDGRPYRAEKAHRDRLAGQGTIATVTSLRNSPLGARQEGSAKARQPWGGAIPHLYRVRTRIRVNPPPQLKPVPAGNTFDFNQLERQPIAA